MKMLMLIVSIFFSVTLAADNKLNKDLQSLEKVNQIDWNKISTKYESSFTKKDEKNLLPLRDKSFVNTKFDSAYLQTPYQIENKTYHSERIVFTKDNVTTDSFDALIKQISNIYGNPDVDNLEGIDIGIAIKFRSVQWSLQNAIIDLKRFDKTLIISIMEQNKKALIQPIISIQCNVSTTLNDKTISSNSKYYFKINPQSKIIKAPNGIPYAKLISISNNHIKLSLDKYLKKNQVKFYIDRNTGHLSANEIHVVTGHKNYIPTDTPPYTKIESTVRRYIYRFTGICQKYEAKKLF